MLCRAFDQLEMDGLLKKMGGDAYKVCGVQRTMPAVCHCISQEGEEKWACRYARLARLAVRLLLSQRRLPPQSASANSPTARMQVLLFRLLYALNGSAFDGDGDLLTLKESARGSHPLRVVSASQQVNMCSKGDIWCRQSSGYL